MTPLARYEPLGACPYYFTDDGGDHDSTIHTILARTRTRAWDLDGVRAYLDKAPDGFRTCFRGVRAVGPGTELVRDGDNVRLIPAPMDCRAPIVLESALRRAVASLVADGCRAAVALSGGLDSALLVALLRAIGRDDIPVFTLATHLDGYCELAETRDAAAKLGVQELRIVEACSLVAALPDAIAAAETPLFNLHPVSRWILATELKREGFEVLLTGDGADQVFAGSDPRNYVPIVGAMTRAAGLELRSPFFDSIVRASAPPPTPEKSALRALAANWLSTEIVRRPKTARLAPPLDVSEHWNATAICALSDQLGAMPPAGGADATRTLWTTLGLLARFLD